eukprot:102833-Karenia_brevis.AAC.1
MAQAEAIAQESLLESIAGTPWTANKNTTVHDTHEYNINLDDWRSGKKKRTSSSLTQSETQDQTGTI